MAKKKSLLAQVLANLPPEIQTGDKVRLNIRRIHGQPGWRQRRKDYRDFVNNNKNTVFTAVRRSDQIIELVDESGSASGWLFWQTDLVLLEDK